MKRCIYILFIILMFWGFVGCENFSHNTNIQDVCNLKIGEITMKIDNIIVDVTWEENDSVKELFNHAKDGLTINMSRYGGFEQVGSIGKNIVSSNKQMSTKAGDIVLYNSNQIVIFFGTNTWSYTKLGHMNLNQQELTNLLDKDSVTLYLGV